MNSNLSIYAKEDLRHRTFSWGKYLVPLGGVLPLGGLQRAPASFSYTRDVPTSNTFSIGTAPGLPEAKVAWFRGGETLQKTLQGLPSEEQILYRFEQGTSVGRHCCLIDGNGAAVFETGFIHKYGVDGPKTYHPVDPRYWKYRRRGNLTARWSIPRIERIAGVAMALNNCSCHNFYHWMTEVASRITAAQAAGLHVDHYLVDHQANYQRWVLQQLGTRPEQWIQPHCNLSIQADQMLWCNPATSILLHRMADRITRHTEDQNKPVPHRKIFITRRSARHRKLVNETEVVSHLASDGYEVHDFQTIPYSAQLQIIQEAASIVTIHGAALASTIFALPGTRIVELFPERRSNYDLFPNLSRMMGHHHVLVSTKESRYGQSLQVQTADIQNALKHLTESGAV